MKQNILGKERGQVVMVGFVFLFIILVIFMTVVYIPSQQNTFNELESEHRAELRAENEKLSNAFASEGKNRVSLGEQIQYPPIFPFSGSTYGGELNIETTESYDTVISGNGSDKIYSNRNVLIEPKYDYNSEGVRVEGENPVFIHEYGIVFEQGVDSDAQSTLTPQRIIDGKEITLYTNTNSKTTLTRGTATFDVDTEKTTETQISPDSNETLEIKLRTNVSESTWNTALRDEMESNGGQITDINYVINTGEPNTVVISLKDDTYSLEVYENTYRIN